MSTIKFLVRGKQNKTIEEQLGEITSRLPKAKFRQLMKPNTIYLHVEFLEGAPDPNFLPLLFDGSFLLPISFPNCFEIDKIVNKFKKELEKFEKGTTKN